MACLRIGIQFIDYIDEYNSISTMLYELHQYQNSQRASKIVLVISLIVGDSCILEKPCVSFDIFSKKKPGFLGRGNAVSLPNTTTTDDMLGLSSGCCCTHKRLRWIQRSTSENGHNDFPKHSSINSRGLASFQSIHA